jgi:hypothetical protein
MVRVWNHIYPDPDPLNEEPNLEPQIQEIWKCVGARQALLNVLSLLDVLESSNNKYLHFLFKLNVKL